MSQFKATLVYRNTYTNFEGSSDRKKALFSMKVQAVALSGLRPLIWLLVTPVFRGHCSVRKLDSGTADCTCLQLALNLFFVQFRIAVFLPNILPLYRCHTSLFCVTCKLLLYMLLNLWISVTLVSYPPPFFPPFTLAHRGFCISFSPSGYKF